MGATHPPRNALLCFLSFFSRLDGLFQLKKTMPAVACVCAFILIFNPPHLSSFCTETEWNHYRKHTHTQKKNMTDQLAILQSLLLHLTGTGLPPATSPLRGEERWEEKGGGRGGTSLHIKSDLKNKKQKSTFGPFFFFFSFFYCAEVKSSAIIILLLYY